MTPLSPTGEKNVGRGGTRCLCLCLRHPSSPATAMARRHVKPREPGPINRAADAGAFRSLDEAINFSLDRLVDSSTPPVPLRPRVPSCIRVVGSGSGEVAPN
ncbi:hypothetical protein DAI22_07g188150 [Oryza sativa Japonica Group]|nr:hypothetical protein DAI22_07g188150 [Oryza sativa Japonica Group]